MEQLEERTSALHLCAVMQEQPALPLSFVCRTAHIYTKVFRATGDEAAIDVALGLYRAALAAFTQPDLPECLSAMNGLAFALRICFDRRRIPSDLEEAILLSREAVALSSSSSEPTSLWNLGTSLRVAYDNLSGYTVNHLEEAISVLRGAAAGQLLAVQCSSRPNYLAVVDLGDALLSWFRHSGEQDALLEATSLLENACCADGVEDADRIYSTFIFVCAIQLQVFMDIAISTSLVDRCVHIGKQILMLHGDWQHRLLLMQALGTVLRENCFNSGSIAEVDEAVDLLRRAARLDPEYLCRRATFLGDLGLTLWRRFRLTGSAKDLEESIERLRAYRDLAVSDVDRVSACSLVSSALLARFEVYHASEDIEECIALAREARQSAPARQMRFYLATLRLALSLTHRYYHIKHNYEDLNEAIIYAREYLANTSMRDWYGLIQLGWALRLHYEGISPDRDTLAEARECHMEAMSMATDQQNRISITNFHLLEDSLAAFAVDRDSTVHDEAMCLFWKLMANRNLVPMLRFGFSSTIIKDFGYVLPVTSMLDISRHALSLLPQVAYLGLEINAPTALLQAAELAATAAKCALSIDKIAEAVESIELGRAVFWFKTLQLRIQCDDIPGSLAQEFFELSRTLDGHSRLHSQSGVGTESEELLSRRHTMIDRYDELLLQIRSIPGHEDFLLPHSFQKLCTAAQGGFLVMLSPADVGYNAIILDATSTAPQVVHLSDVTNDRLVILSDGFNREVEWWRERNSQQVDPSIISDEIFVDRLQMAKKRTRELTVESLLAELWRTAVCPVIEALQIPNRRGSQDRPRLFWCPTGPYVSIPLHAAGIYTTVNGPCATDYVIQSYIPTVSALLHAQRPEQPPAGSEQHTLLVAQSSAPGYDLLPNTVQEINVVANILGKAQLLGAGSPCTATVQAVSSALSSASIVHLACHGKQDKEALRSGFVMNDGLLTVDELMRLEMPHAKFAFLSACHAAAINPNNPPDEVVHLAAAMLYSGFRSVIATMWSMNDADGPAVAREVYTEAFKGGHLDLSRVPYALDAAVQKLKDDGVPASRWATYIHMGV